MIRLLVMCGLAVGAGLGNSVSARPPGGRAEAPAPRPVKPRPAVLITAEFDKYHVRTGDTVRLTELVPAERDIRVRSIFHVVYTIGTFDRATGELVNREPEKPLYAGCQEVFGTGGGSVMALGDKYFPFDVRNPRQEGLEFEFKAQQPGIYLVKAQWTLWRSGEVIESNPVILTVRPAEKADRK